MIFTEAHAADASGAASTTMATTESATVPPGAAAPADAMLMNVGMVIVLAALFYLLLIRPQQKRFKEHNAMINKMDKGSKVVTQGGLVGVIDKIVSDQEVVIDFGNNVKMNMLRSYILGSYADSIVPPANDDSKSKKDKTSK